MQHLVLWLTVHMLFGNSEKSVDYWPHKPESDIIVPRKNNSKNSASSRDNGVDSVADSTNQWKFMSAYYACILCMMSHTGPDDITQ